MAVLTSYAGSRDNYTNFGTADALAQSFQIQTNSIIRSCKINGSRGSASSGTFKLEIRSTSPTGTVLATTGVLNSNVLPAYNASGVDILTSFDFTTPYSASLGVTYFLVFTAVTGHVGDELRWNIDTTSPSYSYGNFYISSTSYPTRDALFSIDGQDVPLLGTTSYDNLSQTSVRVLGEVTADGETTITERGFVYSTSATPTIANSKSTVSGTVGTYNATLTGLTLNTTYYVRAFATNSLGTGYSNEISFTTLNIPQYEIQYPFEASDGDTFVGQITVTGTLGTVTVSLGTTGTSTVINAGSGATAFSGTYNGLSGLIITRSATFNGTIDNVYYAKVPLGTTIDWSLNNVVITTSIPSEVFFKRVEDQIFNNFRFYRYLDLLFKDLDGYITVTVRQEREDNTTEKSKVFVVGNPNSGTVSPFQKKRISFLCKDQAIIIGLSNDNLNETFSIAQYLLIGDKKPKRMISPSKVISVS